MFLAIFYSPSSRAVLRSTLRVAWRSAFHLLLSAISYQLSAISYQLSAISFFPYPLFAPFALFALFFDSAARRLGCKYLFSLLTCRLAIEIILVYNSTYVLYWQIREQGTGNREQKEIIALHTPSSPSFGARGGGLRGWEL